MPAEPFDTQAFIRAVLNRGWRWSDADPALLVHPDDHDMAMRYDARAGRLTASPKLEEQLQLVIPTPPSKGRFWR